MDTNGEEEVLVIMVDLDKTIADIYRTDLLEKLQNKQNMTYDEILEDITTVDMKPSLLIFSGGLDTTTLLYYLWMKLIPIEVLSFDYGQEAVKELEYVKKHCEKLGVKHTIIKMSSEGLQGNLAKGKEKSLDGSTLIPNRNSIFLSAGVSYALQNGLERVYYGAISCDPAYCDCQPLYVHYFNMLNMVCDLREVQIKAPFINKSKKEVMDIAIDLDLDLDDTWTCLCNGEKPCGVCEACRTRKDEEHAYLNELNKKIRNVQKSLNNYEK